MFIAVLHSHKQLMSTKNFTESNSHQCYVTTHAVYAVFAWPRQPVWLSTHAFRLVSRSNHKVSRRISFLWATKSVDAFIAFSWSMVYHPLPSVNRLLVCLTQAIPEVSYRTISIVSHKKVWATREVVVLFNCTFSIMRWTSYYPMCVCV